jgi:hypothetical protein
LDVSTVAQRHFFHKHNTVMHPLCKRSVLQHHEHSSPNWCMSTAMPLRTGDTAPHLLLWQHRATHLV